MFLTYTPALATAALSPMMDLRLNSWSLSSPPYSSLTSLSECEVGFGGLRQCLG